MTSVPPESNDQLRAEAELHIADHALGEAERIARLSRIREFVLGVQDGLRVPLGVVTGMAAANPARSLIIVAGLASEGQEIAEFPERETAELALILEREGLDRAHAERVARGLASNPNVFLRTKIEKELGISPESGGAAFGDALAVGFTYLVAAIVPLWPYFFFARSTALVVSLVCTLVALFLVGVAQGRVTRLSLVRAGVQVAIIGSASAGVGFAIGHVVTSIAG